MGQLFVVKGQEQKRIERILEKNLRLLALDKIDEQLKKVNSNSYAAFLEGKEIVIKEIEAEYADLK